MPTPIIHSTVGVTIGILCQVSDKKEKIDLKNLFLFVVASNIVDLDFIPGFFFQNLHEFHHGISHSFLIALILGITLKLMTKAKNYWPIICTLTHPLLDLGTMDNFHLYSNHYGIPLFWPLSEQKFLAFYNLFDAPYVSLNILEMFNLNNLKVILKDSFLSLSALSITFFLTRRKLAFPRLKEIKR